MPTLSSSARTAPSVSSSPGSTTSAPAVVSTTAGSGASNGKNYAVTTMLIEGSTPDNRGHWHVKPAQLSGGDPAVIEAFDTASLATARLQIDQVRTGGNPAVAWNLEGDSEVTFRNTSIGQVLNSKVYAGAAPTVYFRTMVIDSRTARLITLADLFINEQDGLNRVSEQLKVDHPDFGYQAGFDPTPEHFTNWVPTAEGLEFYFAPYQFGVRFTYPITVRWSAVADLLAPNMVTLAQG